MTAELLENPVRRKLEADEIVLMMSLRHLRTPDAAMMVRECGFDGFYVDCEHGSYSRAETAALCTSALLAGLMPAVRVPTADAGDIAAALDGGALAVIVPHVSSAADAQAAVRAAKYPPLGTRSIAALGPATRYRSLPLAELAQLQNRLTMVFAMLETAEGIAAADAIAAVPGVDVLMLGPADLSTELGIPGELKHPRIIEAWQAAAAAARRHGKHFVAGAGAPDPSDMVARGARILMGGNDAAYLMSAARQAAAAMRSHSPKQERRQS
jgi:2-keto-3-deoxy-L-rhamnonate aldolase RhmA